DMGGTTFDVSVIDGNTPRRRESTNINKYEMYLPMLDVESIGAGGGSIAWIDPASGTMKVGPQSAGADPGPIAYQRGGTEPTVTDAAIALGYVDPDTFLQGRMRLDDEASRRGLGERVGAPLGFDVGRAAVGVFEVLIARTAGKVREITV